MNITLCMIVKNEERTIQRCLASAEQFAEEIIIVDTGSTDHTIDICSSFSKVKIIQHQWNHHFAEARNFALKFAKSEWILWLDADEQIEYSFRHHLLLQKITKETSSHFIYLPILNYYDKSTEQLDEKKTFLYYQPRLFRNNLGIHFINRIHETPILPDPLQPDICYAEIPIHHVGYLEDPKQQAQKSKRNISLLKMDLNDPTPWTYYHLASEFSRTKSYMAAFDALNTAILKFLLLGQKPPSLLYRLKYTLLIEANLYEQAWPSIQKAIELYPDYVDLHFCKALILKQRKQYAKAILALDTCLALGDHGRQYLILKGTGSFRAQQLKEECFRLLENSIHYS